MNDDLLFPPPRPLSCDLFPSAPAPKAPKKKSARREASRRRRLVKELRRVLTASQREIHRGVSAGRYVLTPEELATIGHRWTEMHVEIATMKEPRPWWTPPSLAKLGLAADGSKVRELVPLGPLVAHLDPYRARRLLKSFTKNRVQKVREAPVRVKNERRRQQGRWDQMPAMMKVLIAGPMLMYSSILATVYGRQRAA
jgi:hypothetical protein